MKRFEQAAQLSSLLILTVQAQGTNVVTNPSDTGVVTSYYTTCPSTVSTTITLPGTTTICVGGDCNNPYPILTAEPTPITIFGPDGRETIYNIQTTILPALCSGGVCGATYTLTEQCPCTAAKTITIDACPSGFTTTAVACNACASSGGPATVTLTTPMANGPYASQTPSMGPPVNCPSLIADNNKAVATDSAAVNSASPASNMTTSANNVTSPINPIITPFQGSASRLTLTASASFAVFVGALALLL